MAVLWGLGGALLLLAVAVAFSLDRRRISPRTVLTALAVQVVFGALVLYWSPGRQALKSVSDVVQKVIDSANAGITFVFGSLLDSGFAFALKVLPVIVFIASLTSVLYHIGVLQVVVRVVGGAFSRLFGTSVPESMNTAANIFLGHTEAPLLIKPYLKRLSQSELFAVMTGGMATVSGSVLVGYSLLGVPLEYLIAAAFMAAPGALVMAKILVPAGASVRVADGERSGLVSRLAGRLGGRLRTPALQSAPAGTNASQAPASDIDDDGQSEDEGRAANVVEAAARGASEGLGLALNIGAMLIAFISLIALLNLMIGGVGGWFGHPELSMQSILGWIVAPVMFVLGVPWSEAAGAGSLIGQKVILNEFVAFTEFGPIIDHFSEKSQAIITFGLTGFANLAAIAMQIGALGSLAPNQRSAIAQLGVRAVLAGTLANLMSATIAGVMVSL